MKKREEIFPSSIISGKTCKRREKVISEKEKVIFNRQQAAAATSNILTRLVLCFSAFISRLMWHACHKHKLC